MMEQIEEEEQRQMIWQLAGEEDPTRWSAAIAQVIHKYRPNQPILFLDRKIF